MPPKWMSKYLINQGNKHFQHKEYNVALAAFDLAVSADPESQEALLGYGDVCQVLHRYDEAIRYYTAAFALNPRNTDALIQRGTAYHLCWRLNEALEDFTQAARLNPQLAPLAYLARGSVYGHMNNYEQALRDFEHVIMLQPKNADAYFYHALALIRLGCCNEALASLNKALYHNPGHELAAQLIAELSQVSATSQRTVMIGRMKVFQDVQTYMGMYPIH